ncbi:dimethylamine monooxygenase subunit DmmA family protein [Actinomadura sp. SCN-SB]|uniref:dimethylamine monooxygenase subunit DmmA family protein n=1 Tax=Actinomadura sp. SCN-SB TaxID=3373092 RepID=UPI0037508C5A
MRVDHTSVPRLAGAAPPAVDPSGRSYAVIAVGAAARPVAGRWLAELASRADRPPVWSARVDRLDGTVLAAFEERLRAATVGWRLMLAGPEADVMRLRARAVRAGAVPAEIREHATEADRRRIHCAHCRAITEAEVGVGGTVECRGCGLTLRCQRHFSRRLAAYLGVEAS